MQSINALIRSNEHVENSNREQTTQAFERILSGSLESFYRQAYRLLGNVADAEDAVQDALLAAYAHVDQFRGQSQITTWLCAIVLNCARMQLRRRARHASISLDEPVGEIQKVTVSERLVDPRLNPEHECQISELKTRLSRLHRHLSPTLLRTFQLRDIEGLSVRETARILGVPHGTVKAQSARARKKLKDLMRRTLRPRSHRLKMETPVPELIP